MLGLHNLIYVARTHNQVCRGVVAQADSPAGLPLAITSINMTTYACVVASPRRWIGSIYELLSWTMGLCVRRFVMEIIEHRLLDA